jgi:hypothetical protein
MTNKDRQLVQQPMITSMLTIVQFTTSLPTYVPRCFDHQPSDGGQPGDSPGGSSHGGNQPREPFFNPHVGSFGWPTFNLRMFIPPWYQPLVMQHVLEPMTKLPYMKLQHPTYVKDIDLDVHIKVFKKDIKLMVKQ